MASRLVIEYNDKAFKKFLWLGNLFPELMARILGYVGARGRDKLKQQYLSGQEITLRKYPTDKIDRPTISYSIAKKAKHVKIRSYPVNLFEKGRKLRSGRMESGKWIITRKFKQLMMTQLQSIVKEVEPLIIKDYIGKI